MRVWQSESDIRICHHGYLGSSQIAVRKNVISIHFFTLDIVYNTFLNLSFQYICYYMSYNFMLCYHILCDVIYFYVLLSFVIIIAILLLLIKVFESGVKAFIKLYQASCHIYSKKEVLVTYKKAVSSSTYRFLSSTNLGLKVDCFQAYLIYITKAFYQ